MFNTTPISAVAEQAVHLQEVWGGVLFAQHPDKPINISPIFHHRSSYHRSCKSQCALLILLLTMTKSFNPVYIRVFDYRADKAFE